MSSMKHTSAAYDTICTTEPDGTQKTLRLQSTAPLHLIIVLEKERLPTCTFKETTCIYVKKSTELKEAERLLFDRLLKGGYDEVISDADATLFLVNAAGFFAILNGEDNDTNESKEKTLEIVAERMKKIAMEMGVTSMNWKEIIKRDYGDVNCKSYLEWERVEQIPMKFTHPVTMVWGTLFK